MKQIFQLIASMGLLALTACHAPGDAQPKQSAALMELKIYAVPAAQTNKLAEALGNALGGKAAVTSPAPGKLMIYATSEAQASIGEAIDALAKAPAKSAAPVQVGVHFWVVNGESGAGADDTALKPLASALESVRKNMGPLHFSLVQTVFARTSTDGNDVSIVAAPAGRAARNFDFAVKGVNGQILDSRLDYYDSNDRGLYKFKSEVNLHSGHYVVLAQGPGACARAVVGPSEPPCPVTPALRLLIVRADILPPQS